MHLARQLLEVDLYGYEWWRQTAKYPLYLSLPRAAWTRGNCIVDIADCPRGHWYGPDYLLRGLAREFRDGHAQWLAEQVDEANVTAPGAPWLNLVWYDPSVAAEPPARLPTLWHFDDMGIVSARSDWSGSEALAVLKCGPFIGHKAVQEFTHDPGGGHVHPDANHFVLFGSGEWLLRDDGYRAKWTGQHNTLLVDGRGQLGEGKMWFSGSELLRLKARPRILRAHSSADLDHIAGDASEAYPHDLGLRRYVRHLLFLKPDVLIVCDEVELGQPHELELRFHPESRQFAREGSAFVFTGRKAALRLEPLTLTDVRLEAAELEVAGRHGERTDRMFAVRLSRKAEHWRNAVALSWTEAGQPPQRVVLDAKGDVWTFRRGDTVVSLNWQAGMASDGKEYQP
jgi:hypothetical protein